MKLAGNDVLDGAKEQSTNRFRLRVKSLDPKDDVVIRLDRPTALNLPTHTQELFLTHEEADALLIALMNEI